MIERIIFQYVNKITKQDILDFANKKRITLTDDELEFIFYQVKNNWKTIIFSNPSKIFNELSHKTTPQKYKQIEDLYFEFKNKYKNYL